TVGPAIYHARGTADFDDLEITIVEENALALVQNVDMNAALAPSPRSTQFAVVDERLLFSEDFEHLGGRAQPAWGQGDGAVLVENGKHFFRQQGNNIRQSHELFAKIPLPRNWKRLTVSASIRTRDLKIDPDWEYLGTKVVIG